MASQLPGRNVRGLLPSKQIVSQAQSSYQRAFQEVGLPLHPARRLRRFIVKLNGLPSPPNICCQVHLRKLRLRHRNTAFCVLSGNCAHPLQLLESVEGLVILAARKQNPL